MSNSDLFLQVHSVLLITDPHMKCAMIAELFDRWRSGELQFSPLATPVEVDQPGRPIKPDLVSPRKLKNRSLHTPQGRLSFMHAIAHIEFNAINLACDAICRFNNMPREYYDNWLEVASDEARHFQMLEGYLQDNGCRYGDYPAHNGLWDVALKTSEDVLVRMALVPRVLEARGLDVTPDMINRLKLIGDLDAAGILEVIYQEEITHVAYGSYWFQYLCSQRGLDAQRTFFELINCYFDGALRGPFNLDARKQAGFSQQELKQLSQQ